MSVCAILTKLVEYLQFLLKITASQLIHQLRTFMPTEETVTRETTTTEKTPPVRETTTTTKIETETRVRPEPRIIEETTIIEEED